MPNVNECPPDPDWLKFLDGRVSRDHWDELAEHLNSCPSCSQRLEKLENNNNYDWAPLNDSNLKYTDEPQCANLIDALLKNASAQDPHHSPLSDSSDFDRDNARDRDNAELSTEIRGSISDTRTAASMSLQNRQYVAKERNVFAERSLVGCLVLGFAAVCFVGYQWRPENRTEQLERQLLEANIEEVPALLQRYNFDSGKLALRLQQRLAQEPSRNDAIRCRLALLSIDKSHVTPLLQQLANSTPSELEAITTFIKTESGVTERVEKTFNDQTLLDKVRFRLGMALLHLGSEVVESPEFKMVLTEGLISEGELAEHWIAQIVARKIDIDNALQDIIRHEKSTTRREIALQAFTKSPHSDIEDLLSVIVDLRSGELSKVLSLFKRHGDNGIDSLHRAIIAARNEYETDGKSWTNERRAARAEALHKMLLMIAMLGKTDFYFQHLKHHQDSTIRALLIHKASEAGLHLQHLWNALDRQESSEVKAAILLALGSQIDRASLSDEQQNILLDLFKTHPDAEVHSASEWLLKLIGLDARLTEIKKEVAVAEPADNKRWYILHQGITMSVIEGGEFEMGNADREAGAVIARHPHVIPRRFAISTTELSVAQYRQFGTIESIENTDNIHVPLNNLSLQQAMQCCLELSKAANVPEDDWCYVRNETTQRLQPHPQMLIRRGYRLPTAGEWEFACRAGTTTPTSFGTSAKLSTQYAWLKKNSMLKLHPVGTLRPNQFGIFDMHGNGSEWTQTCRGEIGNGEMLRDALNFKEGSDVFVCGNSYEGFKAESSTASPTLPDSRQSHFVVRLVRTLSTKE